MIVTHSTSASSRYRIPSWASAGAALLAAAAILAGCDQANGKGAGDEAAKAPPPVPVEVALPRRADMLAVYSGTSTVVADHAALIMPKVQGEIVAVLADEGDRVRAGQVLARLDGDQLRLELAQAEANLRKLERDYERNVELQKRGLVSVTAFDNLRYELDAARATYDLAQLRLSYTEIRSPIPGIVIDRRGIVRVGNTVTPVGGVIETTDSALFAVADFDSLVVNVQVPETQMSRLAVGQPARVRVDAVPGRHFDGRISLITPYVDEATATFPVKLELEDPDGLLRPGMFARVDIVYERRPDALQIPRSALLDGDGPPRVFVATDGTARERLVELGLSNGGYVEVLSGVEPGDQVVVIGQGALKEGAVVRVVNEPAPAAAG
jgi:membrane fusion protein (multidrug efflux system)